MAPEFGEDLQLLPLIPAEVLKKHKIEIPLDTRFRAAARLLQALWRVDRNLPIGDYIGEDGERRELGSRISQAAGRTGGNFLTPAIAVTARREAAYREIGAMIDEERLWTNLLSSMPLAFNMFALWRRDPQRANAILGPLIPGFLALDTRTLFEHAPARGDVRFTGDGTAFDVLVRYTTPSGRKGFVAFEIKYSESMQEPMRPLGLRYDELAEKSGLFIAPANPVLRTNPLQQFFREHLLAQTMIDNGLYEEGHFVVIAPSLNHHAQNATAAYAGQLREQSDGRVFFHNITLERFIDAVREAGDADHAAALHRRYTDFWLVDSELGLETLE